MAQTLEQFGQTIKAKYPQYNDISDAELGQKTLDKYPQYRDMVSTPVLAKEKQIQQKFVADDQGIPRWRVPEEQIKTIGVATRGQVTPEEVVQSGMRPVINLPLALASGLKAATSIPSEIAKTYQEGAANRAQDYGGSKFLGGLGTLGEATISGLESVAAPFSTVGNTILGAIQAGVKKATGVDLNDRQAAKAHERLKEILNNPLDEAGGLAETVYKLTQEEPQIIPTLLEGGRAGLAKKGFKTPDVIGVTGRGVLDIGKQVAKTADTGVQKVGGLLEKVKPASAPKIISEQFRKITNQYTRPGEILFRAEKQFGTDPIGVLSLYGNKIIPELNKQGKITSAGVRESTDFLKKQIGVLSELKNEAVFLNDEKVSLRDFGKRIGETIKAEANKRNWTPEKTRRIDHEANQKIGKLNGLYKDNQLEMRDLDKMKTEEANLSKSYNNPNAKFDYDTHGVISKTAKELVELFTDDAPTRELNKLIQSHYDAIDLMRSLKGFTPHGGRFTKVIERVGGGVTGAILGSSVGHPFIGATAGRFSMEVLNNLIRSKFISNPLKRMIVNSAEIEEPAVVSRMLKYIDETTPSLEEIGQRQITQNNAEGILEQASKMKKKESARKQVDDLIDAANGKAYHGDALQLIERAVKLADENNIFFPVEKIDPGMIDYYDYSTGMERVGPPAFLRRRAEQEARQISNSQQINSTNKSSAIAPSTPDIKGILEQAKENVKDYVKSPKIGLSMEDVTAKLRASNRMSAQDIMAKYPDINLKRDVPVTDVYGKKSVIDAGEALTPYELKGNKVLLQDGETYIVSKNQYQNIKGNAVSGEAKPFAPELKGTEETVTGGAKKQLEWTQEKNGDFNTSFNGKDISITPEGSKFYVYEKGGRLGKTVDSLADAKRNAQMYVDQSQAVTKYSSYTLPEGKNYKEVLIKAPIDKTISKEGFIIEKLDSDWLPYKYRVESPNSSANYKTIEEAQKAHNKNLGMYGDIQVENKQFKSSHWDEPNVISHLRLNERTYKGKKVTFMEELQSDWARELRSKGEAKMPIEGTDFRLKYNSVYKTYTIENLKQGNEIGSAYRTRALAYKAADELLGGGITSNPLLKNWQEFSVKRALKEAVDNNSEYFAWINGEQTSARYNLATQVDNVKWEAEQSVRAHDIGGVKQIKIEGKGGKDINLDIDKTGKILNSPHSQADWKGKKLDEVLGKGLADKIMEKESGTLSGEGLKFGGEWANNLYDKQVANIVEDLTGAKVETIDMGLPIEKAQAEFKILTRPGGGISRKLEIADLKTGNEIIKSGDRYIITDILGDGKFKAVNKSFYEESITPFTKEKGFKSIKYVPEVNKKTFDISTKTTVQQGIRLTDEIKAKIRGEAPVLRRPSGRVPLLAKENQIRK